MTPHGIFAGFAVATACFTRIPVATPASYVERLADAAWAFPLIGAGIGGVAASAFLLVQLVRRRREDREPVGDANDGQFFGECLGLLGGNQLVGAAV